MGLTALLGAANRGSNEIIRVLVDHARGSTSWTRKAVAAPRWAEGVCSSRPSARSASP